ncbi:MAG: flagellar biosynthesis protein FlhB [Planctomycetes bacterium]|nr:flagellar biosynthesis protein FlhB [Planctomycetota bacterium]
MSSQEKTEQPTEHKRRKTRERGQFAKSKDLSSAVELLGAVSALRYMGGYFGNYMVSMAYQVMTDDFALTPAPDGKELIPYVIKIGMWLGLILLPFLFLVVLLALLANWYQVGLQFSTHPLRLNFNKLNPIAGFKRIFSGKAIVMLVMNIAKLAVIVGVAWGTIQSEFMNSLGMIDMETIGGIYYSTDKVLALAQRLAIILLVLGFADFQYQKYSHTKSIKMTKQEVKEEFKQMEGDPKIKAQRRRRQMEIAMQRMMSEVPQAEVVVRNPTHFAVAISYKPDMPAPRVIAKGKDKVAEKIIAIARESRVPLVENPPLARELYKRVEIGDEIPEELFKAVAQLLASVMNEERKRQMMRSMRPSAA